MIFCFCCALFIFFFYFLFLLFAFFYFFLDACQICTFSLLILFYAKLVHRHRWRFLRFRFLGFCILSNTAMVFLTLTFSILMDRVQRTQNQDPTSEEARNVKEFVYKMYFISSAVFFGVLVVLAAFYIHKLRTARGSTAGTSKQEVAVTSMIFLIFLSRCIWDLMAAFDSESTLFRHQIWETQNTHVKLMNAATCKKNKICNATHGIDVNHEQKRRGRCVVFNHFILTFSIFLDLFCLFCCCCVFTFLYLCFFSSSLPFQSLYYSFGKLYPLLW